MGRIIGLTMVGLCFLGSLLLADEFDGAISRRNGSVIYGHLDRQRNSIRPLRATVFGITSLVHLPGSNKTIVNEWGAIGEILCFPPFEEGAFSGRLLSERENFTVSRGAKFKLIPNQAPIIEKVYFPKAAVPLGTKALIRVDAHDPENSGAVIHWKTDKGSWLYQKSRLPYNFFIAPRNKERVNLKVDVVDPFGSQSEKQFQILVDKRSQKDLYRYSYSYFLQGGPAHHLVDAIMTPLSQVAVLEKTELRVFSPEGVQKNHLKGIFQAGLKIQSDHEGYLYILDKTRRMVLKINLDGKVISTYKDHSEEDDFLKMEEPVDLIVRPNLTVHVLDKKLCRILNFTPSGHLIGAIGALGKGDGQFIEPIALCLGPTGNLYVLDQGDQRLKVFDPHYNFLDSVKLSERFSYVDVSIDSLTQKIYVFGNLKPGAQGGKQGGYLIEYDLDLEGEGKTFELEGVGKKGIQSASIDHNGEFLLTTQRKGPLFFFNSKGKIKSQFLQESPIKGSLLAIGELGNIFFQSGKGVKRLNYFGRVDQYYSNNKTILGFSIDSQENLYLLNKNSQKVKKYDPEGQHVKDIAFKLKKRKKILGFGVDGEGLLYFLHQPALLRVLSPDGAILREEDLSLKASTHKGSQLFLTSPMAFHVDRDGLIYSFDKKLKKLFIFDSKKGSSSILEGRFSKIKDIALDLYKNIYLLDSSNKKIFKYNSRGLLRREIDIRKECKGPTRIKAFGDGVLVVYDGISKTLNVYN